MERKRIESLLLNVRDAIVVSNAEVAIDESNAEAIGLSNAANVLPYAGGTIDVGSNTANASSSYAVDAIESSKAGEAIGGDPNARVCVWEVGSNKRGGMHGAT